MYKWNRKKAQLTLFTILFMLLILSSLLSNHDITREPPHFTTFSTRTTSSHRSKHLALNGSDWSKACASPRRYRGKARVATEHSLWREGRAKEGCDLFSGRWVYDEESRPLYEEAGCPWMSDQLACTKHGRPDTAYQRWRWQPHGCNLKR